MKTPRVLLLASAAVMMCASCGDDEGTKNMVEHSYLLALSFVDAEGNDLAAGLEGTEPEGSIEANYVVRDQYTLVTSPNSNELWPWEGSFPQGLGMTPAQPWESDDPSPSIGLFSSSNGLNNLSFVTTSAPWYEGVLETITHTLTCPHIFGDDEPHEIVTYWKDPDTGPTYYSVCYRIVVDGREFTDISGKQLPYATIVLDR